MTFVVFAIKPRPIAAQDPYSMDPLHLYLQVHTLCTQISEDTLVLVGTLLFAAYLPVSILLLFLDQSKKRIPAPEGEISSGFNLKENYIFEDYAVITVSCL
jgi:hypothetical protein